MWRWICAAPWLASAVWFVIQWAWGVGFGYWGDAETVVYAAMFIVAPVGIAAAIVAAPPGAWLILVGLAASAAGVLLMALVVAIVSLIGAIGGGRWDTDYVQLAVAAMALVGGLAVLLLAVLDPGHGPPRTDPG